MSRTVVGDFDFKADGVAFGGCAVTAGQCLDGHQISIGFDNDRFIQIIAGGAWVGLIPYRCSGRVGDCVATLTDINGSSQRQRCRATSVQRSNGEQSGGRVVRSLCNGTGNKSDSGGQRIGE